MGVARIFFGGGEHFFKKFSKNIPKIFKKYSKKFQRTFKEYSKNIQEIFKKYSKKFQKIFQQHSKSFRKFLKIFLRKLLKTHYFSIVFSNLTMHVNFCAFGRKTQFPENF